MNLDSDRTKGYDPLKISGIIGDFKKYYDDLDFDLRVVSVAGKSQNMQLRLYINGINSNNIPNYSLAYGDKNMITVDDFNRDTIKSQDMEEDKKELEEAINSILHESSEMNEWEIEEGLETSKTEANKYELRVTDSL